MFMKVTAAAPSVLLSKSKYWMEIQRHYVGGADGRDIRNITVISRQSEQNNCPREPDEMSRSNV